MKILPKRPVIALAVTILVSMPVAWGDTLSDQLAAAIKESTINLGFRYRFEAVDDNAFGDDAWASTLRSRLTVVTRPFNGFSAVIEVDDVRDIGTSSSFNDTRNGVSHRPVVADPDGTDLNQAYLRYTGLQGTDIRLGRQRIERNNQRFISGSGWRQNEQTFDAISISHELGNDLNLSYAWISQVNRVHGPDKGNPPADFDSSTHLFDASYRVNDALTLAGYWYRMDFRNAVALSNKTAGLRATGSFTLNDTWKLPYTVEYAKQSDHADNPLSYHASYYLAEFGISSSRVGLKLGYEVLEGSRSTGKAFRTPLATPHAFQGWADKFATTPDEGMEDFYIALSGKALGADLLLRFHDFNAEQGSADWGREFDFSASWAIGKHYAVLLKGASYDADDFASNTKKYWLMLSASF